MTSQWIGDFIKTHGRAPRILHIGNIANNAYQNAKMLNEAGCDCDVLCADYYHCMGCPEWDAADYTGDIEDQFFPAWHKVDLHGFERPRWFAQAPRALAVEYLIARREGQARKASRLWKKMNLSRTSRKKAANYGHLNPTYIFYLKLRKALYLLFTDPARLIFKLKTMINPALKPHGQPQMPREIHDVFQKTLDDFKRLFPDRTPNFKEHLASYIYSANALLPLLKHYDIVEAYATDPILPYLAGYKNYVAFEHGTIRDFPTADDAVSQLAMLAYANAKAIYLTNIDCTPSAEYIARNSATPIVYGLHGLDVERVIALQAAALSKSGLQLFDGIKDVPIFFCPSRHTFDKSKGVFLKREDWAIRAAARLCGEGCPEFKLVLTDWGNDAYLIKEMISELPRLAERVLWIAPLKKTDLYKAYFAVDAVIDQFFWKAYGGIDYETLCASSAVLISSKPDPDYERRFFPNPLPYYGCETEDDIYKAMKEALLEPGKARSLAAQGMEWIKTYHSAEKIVEKNIQAYSYCKI